MIYTRNPFHSNRPALFPRVSGAKSERHGASADIELEVNKALCVIKVPANITIQRLSSKEKRNLNGLIEIPETSNMILPQHWEFILSAVRIYNSEIIDVIGDERRYRLKVNSLNLERYDQQPSEKKKMQTVIEAEPDDIILAYTLL